MRSMISVFWENQPLHCQTTEQCILLSVHVRKGDWSNVDTCGQRVGKRAFFVDILYKWDWSLLLSGSCRSLSLSGSCLSLFLSGSCRSLFLSGSCRTLLLSGSRQSLPQRFAPLGAIHLWRPQKIPVFDPLPLSTWAGLPPLVDVHTWSTWNTHRSLETASTMTYWT